MKRIAAYIACSAFIIAGAGCETIYNPATEKNEVIFIDTAQEVSLGRSMASQVGTQYKISHDQARIARAQRLGAIVAAVSDRKDLAYHFGVIEDKEINAFAVPGGYIYVYTGLMDKASDDELAGVLAHEVGHIAARHSVKQMQVQMGYDILMSLIFRDASAADFQRAISVAFNIVSLGYSREDELLADRLAVKYMVRASRNPYAMVTFLQKLKAEENKSLTLNFEILRSHPDIDRRIRNTEEAIAQYTGRSPASFAPASRAPSAAPAVHTTTRGGAPRAQEHLKFCPKCGRTYAETSRFCTYDGTELKTIQ